MTHNYTYDEMYRAADTLWPGEAEAILAAPTDEQLAAIFAYLNRHPVGGLVVTSWHVANTGNTNATPLVTFGG